MKKQDIVISKMIERRHIPSSGTFNITNNLIDLYYEIYHELFSSMRNKDRKTNITFAKRMAGLNLHKLNEFRSKNNGSEIIVKKSKEKIESGLIYIISNPAFPGYYKVGITRDIEKRLSAYQTCDPLRRYKVEHFVFCLNARAEEKRILDDFSVNIVQGEWVNIETGLKILHKIKENILTYSKENSISNLTK